MNSIVIQVPSKSDLEWLLELVRRLGFKSFAVTEKEARLLARQKLAVVISEVDNEDEPSVEEINEIVDEVRGGC